MAFNNAEPMLKRLKTAALAFVTSVMLKSVPKQKSFNRLRTIANKLIRELQRKLPTHSCLKLSKNFLFYQQY
ncbi:hypothetical protein BSPWISOXPB_4759 [uncultured Gammaproteobacteria bacterium]|nr:hypothetical protein BSPWISOXPB_4759 [uncultured Gammaproteobacteria bacterium]